MGIESSKVIYKIATSQKSRLQIKDVDKFANKMSQFHKFLHKEMNYAQAIQEDYVNKK